MSKTISIPTHNNPFTVIINNKEYTYRGGETIEVPDEVADAIEDALELVPKPKRYLSKFAQRVDGILTRVTTEDLEGVNKIADYSFQGLKLLTDVTVPDNVATVGTSAFYGCTILESIRFGVNSKLNAIGAEAFRWCWGLKSVYLPIIPPVLADTNAFADIRYECTFYCKNQASLDAYVADFNARKADGVFLTERFDEEFQRITDLAEKLN